MDEWKQGYNDAVAYCRANYRPFRQMAMPSRFVHRGDAWSCGFGEGALTTKNKMIDEAYPGNTGFSVDSDGKVTIFYPQDHPAVK